MEKKVYVSESEAVKQLQAERNELQEIIGATRAMAGASLGDPVAALCGVFRLRRSMALMLEAAQISAAGVAGIVRIKGLAAIYLAVLRVWLTDDSDDGAATMAALDKRLGQAETLLALCRLSGRRNSEPEVEGEAA